MKKNYHNLIKTFQSISSNGWIKGINNFTNSAGLTFESLLGKKPDSMFFPDYYRIEIKCTQRFSRFPITLFSSAFDGPSLYEMNRLLNTYGKNDVVYKDKKQLNGTISCNKKTLIYDKIYFKLEISDKDRKIYICIYDLKNNLIEKQSYIEFETLKKKLEIKLSNLAVVFASKKEIDRSLYFRYYKLIIYELISFRKFIDLLKKDIIIVDIEGRISRSGIERGRQRNKNLVFKIKKDNLKYLFNTIDILDENLDKDFQIIS